MKKDILKVRSFSFYMRKRLHCFLSTGYIMALIRLYWSSRALALRDHTYLVSSARDYHVVRACAVCPVARKQYISPRETLTTHSIPRGVTRMRETEHDYLYVSNAQSSPRLE